jgi:hypothetical protein
MHFFQTIALLTTTVATVLAAPTPNNLGGRQIDGTCDISNGNGDCAGRPGYNYCICNYIIPGWEVGMMPTYVYACAPSPSYNQC